MAYTELTNYTRSVGYTTVAQWAATTAYTVGQIRRQLAAPAVNSERCFLCIVAGTSGGSEPTWVLTRGAKTTDSTVTWMECTGLPAPNGDNASTNAWHASAGSIALGWIIKNVANDHYFIATTAGTGGTGAEPSWSTTTGATTADGSVTWTCIGATSSFTTIWAAPHARLARPLDGTSNWLANAAMAVYVGDDHAEANSSGNYTVNPAANCSVLCIDHTVSLPAASGNLKTTATVTDNGSNTLSVMGTPGGAAGVYFYVYGVQFIKTAGSNIYVANASGSCRGKFEQCVFSFTAASGSDFFTIGFQSTAGMLLEFVGCTFHFGASTHTIFLAGSAVFMRNCTVTGAVGAAFIGGATAASTIAAFEGCDLSNLTGNLYGSGSETSLIFKDCKLNASVTTAIDLTNSPTVVDLNRCDSGANAYRNERHTQAAHETTSTGVVRTGGAADGTIAISHRIATTANISSANILAAVYFLAIPLATWNNVTGTNRNVTLYGIVNDSRVPNNDEFWFDVEYLGSASSPQGVFASGFKSDVLAAGSALTADSSAWDSAATARANSHAYAVGDVIKTASNPGRIFFCTTAGTSAGSEPVGGGAITWNPSDLNNTTLSNGNLTATSTSSTSVVGRATGGQISGKYYFEVTCGGTNPGGQGCGVANLTTALTGATSINNTNGAAAIYGNGAVWINGNQTTGVLAAITTGQTHCVAVDLDHARVWFRINNGNWNGSAIANPATNTGGLDISSVFPVNGGVGAVPLWKPDSSGGQVVSTLNVGATSFAYTAPSGFTGPALNGYASAVDGTGIFDGAATFRAGCRFSQTLTLSSPQPQQAGYLYALPKIGRASTTYYLDPKIYLS